MSFVLGPLSGALVAGGFYYGFSNLIQTRTEKHRRDMHTLSIQLITPPSAHPAPASAAARIVHEPFSSILKTQWNERLAGLYRTVGDSEGRLVQWGKKVLYGERTSDS
ncbi:uncharacterized protein STEHIDRAFT_56384 [Stereum hirsutum FP-91666 SS1]|uniref:uncharacterized protein n=1 Tax=Stereum hirsutum (strain FP-91666) TaxID=721885 RepID=UPI000440A12A|nr:uncharacterized protein STEHIDRAFT_56384 [Stereum hirsutum FP-91666 SS1]EIM87364.1 hypothetical protein STEHIDRAFT_56384 [Stereum hirsutum FP-91666 SS1]